MWVHWNRQRNVEKQFDAVVELQLDIMRVSASLQSQTIAILKNLEKRLLGELASGDLTEWGIRRRERQLREISASIKSYYDQVDEIVLDGTKGVADVAAKVTTAAIAPNALLPTESTMAAIASGSIVQGATQGQWWNKQSSEVAFRFAGAVRQGLAGAETNAQIINRVRQVMNVTRANAAALVQTSVATVANDAREAVFKRNDDIIRKYRAVATLDTHTCVQCAPLDGLEWEKDGSPIGHKLPFPNYPLHFNCRCLTIAVVLDDPIGGRRASSEGEVSARLTFEGWLKRQSTEKQSDILGKGRADLWRKGKLTLTDLVNGYGNPLSLDQLQKKYGA